MADALTRPLGQPLRGSIMRDRLLIRAMPLSHIAGNDPIGEGRTEILPFLKMVSQQFRLRRAYVAFVEILQHRSDPLVADPAATAEQAGIGHVAGQRVVERIDDVGRHAAPQDEPALRTSSR